MRKRNLLATGLMAGLLAASLIGCSSGGSSSSSSSKPQSTTESSAQPSSSESGAVEAKPFGAGCTAVPKNGKGSFSGMAQDPVATAASNNPALSTLVTAVKKAGLVDTLNSAGSLTVFAPSNDAFKKIPKKKLNAVLKNKKLLTKILTYHVVKGRNTPDQLATGKKLPTLEGGTVAPSGSGDSYTVNGANVVCGNVQTSNATVYIIDTVMMPKM